MISKDSALQDDPIRRVSDNLSAYQFRSHTSDVMEYFESPSFRLLILLSAKSSQGALSEEHTKHAARLWINTPGEICAASVNACVGFEMFASERVDAQEWLTSLAPYIEKGEIGMALKAARQSAAHFSTELSTSLRYVLWNQVARFDIRFSSISKTYLSLLNPIDSKERYTFELPLSLNSSQPMKHFESEAFRRIILAASAYDESDMKDLIKEELNSDWKTLTTAQKDVATELLSDFPRLHFSTEKKALLYQKVTDHLEATECDLAIGVIGENLPCLSRKQVGELLSKVWFKVAEFDARFRFIGDAFLKVH